MEDDGGTLCESQMSPGETNLEIPVASNSDSDGESDTDDGDHSEDNEEEDDEENDFN